MNYYSTPTLRLTLMCMPSQPALTETTSIDQVVQYLIHIKLLAKIENFVTAETDDRIDIFKHTEKKTFFIHATEGYQRGHEGGDKVDYGYFQDFTESSLGEKRYFTDGSTRTPPLWNNTDYELLDTFWRDENNY